MLSAASLRFYCQKEVKHNKVIIYKNRNKKWRIHILGANISQLCKGGLMRNKRTIWIFIKINISTKIYILVVVFGDSDEIRNVKEDKHILYS